MKINYLKLFVAIIISIYFVWLSFAPEHFGILDYVNLLNHEAGHWIWGLFGYWIGIFGGSFNQVLIPIIVCTYFFLNNKKFSGSLILFWIAQNFFNVAIYAGDAIKMQLNLLGGKENVIHDWNALFIYWGVLRHTNEIALSIRYFGMVILILGLTFSIKHSFNEPKKIII